MISRRRLMLILEALLPVMLIGSARLTVVSLVTAENLTSCVRMIRTSERGVPSIVIVIQDAVITTNAHPTGSVMSQSWESQRHRFKSIKKMRLMLRQEVLVFVVPTGSALLIVVLWEVARNLTSHVRIKEISEIGAPLMMTATQDVVSSDSAHLFLHANFKR